MNKTRILLKKIQNFQIRLKQTKQVIFLIKKTTKRQKKSEKENYNKTIIELNSKLNYQRTKMQQTIYMIIVLDQ